MTLHNINQSWITFTACDRLMLDLYNGLGFSLWRVLLGICDRRLCKMYTYYFFAGEYPPHPRKMINFCSASKSWIKMPWNFGTILVISTRIYHWGNPPSNFRHQLGGVGFGLKRRGMGTTCGCFRPFPKDWWLGGTFWKPLETLMKVDG